MYLRGNLYWADLGAGEKPWLVVSNNIRNQALGSALVTRVTTTIKPPLATIVQLNNNDPLVGSILCDDIETIYDDDPARHTGAVTFETMSRVNEALKIALALGS